MYTPDHFRIDDRDTQFALIRQHPLATLVSSGVEGLTVSHLPLLLKTEPGRSCLEGHFARANPHWRHLHKDTEVLVIFQGEAGYITPSWYPSKAEHGKVVPTWNYATVHARCSARVRDDRDWLLRHVGELTHAQECHRERPWSIGDAPDSYIEAMSRAIVGVELTIERLEGKWKMSQNRAEKDRAGVVAGLEAEGGDAAAALAGTVRRCCGLEDERS